MRDESGQEAAPPRYAGIPTLLRRPLANDPSGLDIALIGIPYDGATENRPGARHGPLEIRHMSSFTRTVHHVTRVDPYERCRIADLGDVPLSNPFDVLQCFDDISAFYRAVCQAGALPLSVGGDHSITLPILRAVAEERPVGLVHIDAHTDTSDLECGQKYTHGTPFRRAMEEGLLDPKRTIQIGIRGSQDSEESWKGSEDAGIRVVFMEEFSSLGVEATLDAVRTVVGDGPTYVSFDIDSLDPAFAPGTGTPEIGGLTPIEAQALIRGLAGLDLIGGDLVEVSPPFDPTGNTALVGATLLYEMVCVLSDTLVRRR